LEQNIVKTIQRGKNGHNDLMKSVEILR